jgi:2-polyprenyl-6-methoxyphenol hydroxylase-like FAD-dependent oxidoreductase
MAPFKVAIIGGGMTGLTAALHLDRLGIDFVLLEAYDDLTPEVGASLALYPNFQRVVDQLGVLDEAHRESSEIAHISCHDIDGNLKYQHDVLDQLHEATGGYGIRTWTRAQLLKVLYGNTSENGKSKMLTGQKVSRIEQLPNDQGVRVHVEGGNTHDVDLVIGADGTHSIVRSEMWRMAEEDKSQVLKNDKGEGRHSLLTWHA